MLFRNAGRLGLADGIAALGCFIVMIMLMASPFSTAAADDQARVIYDFSGSYDDAVFELEGAIVERGLKIDHVSHVGEMLKRTKTDVGGTLDLYENASVFQFCSAVLSRQMMEADLMNIAFCPYGVFVAELSGSGQVKIGYRQMPKGPMDAVEALLDAIARQATGN